MEVDVVAAVVKKPNFHASLRSSRKKSRAKDNAVQLPRLRVSTIAGLVLAVAMLVFLLIGLKRKNELTKAIERLSDRNVKRAAVLYQLEDRAAQIVVSYEKRKRNLTEDIAEAESMMASFNQDILTANVQIDRIRLEIDALKENLSRLGDETKEVGNKVGETRARVAKVEEQLAEVLTARDLIMETLSIQEQELQYTLENLYTAIEKNESLVTFSINIENEYNGISVSDKLLLLIPFWPRTKEAQLESRLQELENRLVDLRHEDVRP